MIAIIDYGLGNIRAFANVYKNLDMPHKIVSTSDDLKNSTKIVLPGVGAFDYAMELLQGSGLREPLDELVLRGKMPVLGICIGMQILAHSSEEGRSPGLGWIDSTVVKIDTSRLNHKTHLPHMGWNSISPARNNPLFREIDEGARFYFLHSYYIKCRNEENIVATTDYGGVFPCAVNSGDIYGVQFHPEKSHQNGVRLLKNFGNL